MRIRTRLVGTAYRRVLRPIYFRIDPETIHDRMSAVGVRLGRYRLTRTITRALFDYRHPMLEQRLFGTSSRPTTEVPPGRGKPGLYFANPIGLAAGFDKEARLMDVLPALGFGFAEVGSITGEPCAGNDRPRLWRLPHSKSLVVNYGLKSDGAEAVRTRLLEQLKQRPFAIPIGMSVAKTNNRATCQLETGVADYAKAFRLLHDLGAYVTVNISCPNTFGGQPFTTPDRLEQLLARLDQIATTKPVLLKMPPDLEPTMVEQLLGVATQHRVQGFICSNLTKGRDNPRIHDPVPAVGGLSGKVVEPLANQLIAQVYRWLHTHGQGDKIVIGCGGVFSATDAYKKIRLGASLIQMITGMIYQGPQIVGQINQGLVELLRRDGFGSIGEAVGVDVLPAMERGASPQPRAATTPSRSRRAATFDDQLKRADDYRDVER